MRSAVLEISGPDRPLRRAVPTDALTPAARTGEIARSAGRNGAGKIPALRAVTGKGPRARLGFLGLAVVFSAALGLCAACDATSSPGAGAPTVLTPGSGVSQYAHSPPQPLIYICQQAPCTNRQEFEIFDRNGAPIFSVGEYGGASVFGDDFRIWACPFRGEVRAGGRDTPALGCLKL